MFVLVTKGCTRRLIAAGVVTDIEIRAVVAGLRTNVVMKAIRKTKDRVELYIGVIVPIASGWLSK